MLTKYRKLISIIILGEFIVLSLWLAFQYFSYHARTIQMPADQLVLSSKNDDVTGSYYDLSYEEFNGIDSPVFTLKKGVYYFSVSYSSTSTARAAISYEHARGSVTSVYEASLNADSNLQSARIYVPDTCTVRFHARLTEDSQPSDYVNITSFTLQSSPLTWVRAFCSLLFLFLLADFLLFAWILYRHLAVPRNQSILLCLLFAAPLLCIPLYRRGLVAAPDLTFHMMRIEGLYEGMQAGQFPVKIQPGWLNGCGYAVSVFYGDFMLYFPAFLRFLGYTIEEAYKAYLFALSTATLFVSFYCFMKLFRSQSAALLGSILYCFSAYHLNTLYSTAQLGCGSAMLYYPVIITGLYLLLFGNTDEPSYKKTWLYLLIGYSGILQSHIISCFMFAFLTIVCFLLFIKRVIRPNTLLEIGKVLLSGILLNLGFLIPFISYYFGKQTLAVTRPIDYDTLDYASYFAKYQKDGWSLDTLASPSGIGIALSLILIGILIFWPYLRTHVSAESSFFFVLSILALCFASCYLPYYKIASLHPVFARSFKTIQYADRFLAPSVLLLSCAAGFVWKIVAEDSTISHTLFWGLILTAMFQGVTLLSATQNTVSYTDISDFTESTIGNGEYLPDGTNQYELTNVLCYSEEVIHIQSWEHHYLHTRISLENVSGEDQIVSIPSLYYKGYHAADVSTGQTFAVSAGENNRASITVPPHYQGTLDVNYQKTILWIISEIFSLSCLGFVLLYVIGNRAKWK